MEQITLSDVLPHVFAGTERPHSDVWKQQICFERGKTYLIEADSGTGKSSLCSFIIGYRHDYEGKILFDNEDVSRYNRSRWTQLRRESLSHIFQELRLFPELTAMENVQIKNQLTGFKDDATIRRWFEQLGIADKMEAKAGLMSFGQQQRVAVIRALVQPFHFLLIDEPISHLDNQNSAIVAQIVTEECRRQGAGLIVTSIGRHPEMSYDKTLSL